MPPPALELGRACPAQGSGPGPRGRVHALTAINTNTPHTTVSFETHRNTVKRSQESMALSMDRL